MYDRFLIGVAALALIGTGTAFCARHLSSVDAVLGIPRSVVALLFPAFGPPGFAALHAILFHHSLRSISIGFSWATIVCLLVTSAASIILGLRSIDARIFRYGVICIPVSVMCVIALGDCKITRLEAAMLIFGYGAFIAMNWLLERSSQFGPPRQATCWTDTTRGKRSGVNGFALGSALVVIGSVLLVELTFGRFAAKPMGQLVAGAGVIAQLLIFICMTLRNKSSYLTIAGVAGFLTFNSAVSLSVVGLTAHHAGLDPTAYDFVAIATVLIPAILFPVAIRQSKRLSPGGHAANSDAQMDNIFAWRNLKRDLSNYQLLGHRDVNGSLITGMNSGTHWVTFMLATAIADECGLELPPYFSFDAVGHIVGIPASLVRRSGVPAIALYHNHPAAPLAWPIVRTICPLPKQVVLVRDIREVLISAYVKWMPHGEISFSEFVRGDPANHRGYLCDVWWYLSFLNRWGDMKVCAPDDTLIVRYEDMVDDPAYWLRRIRDHFGLILGERAIETALSLRDKRAVLASFDPEMSERVIADPKMKAVTKFSAEDTRTLRGILARHLRYDYGYDYGLGETFLLPVDGPARDSIALECGLSLTR